MKSPFSFTTIIIKKINFYVLSLFLFVNIVLSSVTAHASTFDIITAPNPIKPHLACDFSIYIPDNFDRSASSSRLSIQNIHCQYRYLSFTTKDIYPDEYFNCTIGGLSPGTTYEFNIKINSGGFNLVNENVFFTTELEPSDEIKKILLVIDYDLLDPELENVYSQYQDDITTIYPDIEVERTCVNDNLVDKKDLFNSLRTAFFERNIYYVFFIGKNASMPLIIELLDEKGNVTNTYYYTSLSFYTNIWNNEFEYDSQGDRYVQRWGLNTNMTPDLYTRIIHGRIPEISFGAVIPTTNNLNEKKSQIINYFNKLHYFRLGEFTFDKRVLFSDTMYGNATITNALTYIDRWNENRAIETSHVPDPNYHADDQVWKSNYLTALAEESFEICWLNVHGATISHYFGISYTDINALPSLNTCFVVLHSCNNGNYTINNYMAGTYIMKGNVLAVEANMYPTMYIASDFNGFTQGYCYYELAGGERIGDAIRQYGEVFKSHVLFGDPLLSLESPVVPVELTSFNASIINQSIYLMWQTQTETNNYGFNIERSVDSNWKNIGFMKGKWTTVKPQRYEFIDDLLDIELETSIIKYRLKQINTDGSFEYSKILTVNMNIPQQAKLEYNYPNPFNPLTTIKYNLQKSSNIILKIYNIRGQEIETLVNRFQKKGEYQVKWIARGLPSGIYFCRLQAGNFSQTKKLILQM